MDTAPNACHILHGIGVASGIVVARAWNKKNPRPKIPERTISPNEIEAERQKLDNAIASSIQELEILRDDLEQKFGSQNADIINFHIAMLEDDMLHDSIVNTLKNRRCGIEQATDIAIKEFQSNMDMLQDSGMQTVTADIADIGKRLIDNLLGTVSTAEDIPEEYLPAILIAEDLTPNETVHIKTSQVSAFITASGSRTSHTAILARAIGIPAIVAIKEPLNNIEDGTVLAFDAATGTVIVNPDEATIKLFCKREEHQRMLQSAINTEKAHSNETIDGYQTYLVTNVALPEEAMSIRSRYNVGIGLFRTEFLFIGKNELASEEEQFQIYKNTVQSISPYSVIFRTLDIGGDKFITEQIANKEINPFMGTRAIRFSLSKPSIFKTQLRAILRASAYGKVRIMFPMISVLEELTKAIDYLNEVKNELSAKGIPFNNALDVGCMIEVPSAVLLAEKLVDYVDFFSIGTNDLTQYSLAVDRSNADVAYLYQPANPAVLRQLKHVVDIAFAHGKWVSCCGEMAGDPLYTPLLLGMGIHELSMSGDSLAKVRKYIQCIKMYEVEELLKKAIECNNDREVEELCKNYMEKACPELLDN